jgi:dihydroorotase
MITLLKNGRVCTKGGFEKRNVYIDDGLICAYAQKADLILDCDGLFLLPGLFDMHVHFRDPGQTHKEDILTGARAAAAGGFTGVLCMPNTLPPIDSVEAVEYVIGKGKNAAVKVFTSCAITKGQLGTEPLNFTRMRAAGALAATDDGRWVENEVVMRRAMIAAAQCNLPIISHCEVMAQAGGLVNEGAVSRALGVKGSPISAESDAVLRDVSLAEQTGAPLHIAHVSAEDSLKHIRHFALPNVTCETAPHYFILTERDVLNRDANRRMNPPLRTATDRYAIKTALQDGIIHCIATDHAPHTPAEKSDFLRAPNGVIGLETSLPATFTYAAGASADNLPQLVAWMCDNPRRILNLPLMDFSVGCPADICAFDPAGQYITDARHMLSKARNTPFDKMKFAGKVIFTMVNGEVVYADGQGALK